MRIKTSVHISRPLIMRWCFTAFRLKVWHDDNYCYVETHVHCGCTYCHFVETSGDRIKKTRIAIGFHIALMASCWIATTGMVFLSIYMTVVWTWRQRKQTACFKCPAFLKNVRIGSPNSADILSQLFAMARPTQHTFHVFKNKFDEVMIFYYKDNIS